MKVTPQDPMNPNPNQDPTNQDPTNQDPMNQDPTKQVPGKNTALTGDDIADDPTSDASWLSALPEDLRGNERLAGFKTVEELARAHADAQLAPTVPKADEYKLPDGFPLRDIGVWASENKFSQDQLDSMLALNATVRKMDQDNLDKLYEAGLNDLYETWGAEKDTYTQQAVSVVKYFDKSGKLAKLLDDTKAGNNPIVVEFFANMGRALMAEDGFTPLKIAKSPNAGKSSAEIIFSTDADD